MFSYYIIKKAIYIHAIYGPYETPEVARAAFDAAYKDDPATEYYGDFDGHHSYLLVDGLPEIIGPSWNISGDLLEYESKERPQDND